jgi:hypothetical protein
MGWAGRQAPRAKQITTRSLPDIGRRFGGRDHTTVLHAVRREALKADDPVLVPPSAHPREGGDPGFLSVSGVTGLRGEEWPFRINRKSLGPRFRGDDRMGWAGRQAPLAKQITTGSLPAIGRRFGGRGHTTVLRAVRRIEALTTDDPVLAPFLPIPACAGMSGVGGLGSARPARRSARRPARSMPQRKGRPHRCGRPFQGSKEPWRP